MEIDQTVNTTEKSESTVGKKSTQSARSVQSAACIVCVLGSDRSATLRGKLRSLLRDLSRLLRVEATHA